MARLLNIARRIETLRAERERHSQEIEKIDATLEQIKAALGMKIAGRTPMAAAPSKTGRSRRRRTFAVNGLQSVLNFVKENKNATTATINANWKSEGRAGRADVTLGKLVAEKKLKRVKLKGERGSRYVVG